MFKSVLVLFSVAISLMLNVIFGEGVKVTQNSPSTVKPGDEFFVELQISKTDVSGFAKIQQELPAGFTAEAVETQGASFTFNEQKVKLIWMALPESEDFSIKYKVTVGEDVSGEFEITGKFSYLHSNERKTVELNGNFITVKKEEVLAETKPEEITPEPTSTISDNTLTISTSRTITQGEDGNYWVDINIKHNGIEGFAKIQETVPNGISSSESIESEGGVFSFVDGQAKIVWMSMPEKESFKVSYLLKGSATETDFNEMNGTFAYLENEESKKQEILTSKTEINTTEEEPLASTESTVETSTEEEISTEEETQQPDELLNEEIVANEQPLDESNIEAEKPNTEMEVETSGNEQAENIASAERTPVMTSTPSPQLGVNYKVQICAGHNPVDPKDYFKKEFSFTEEAINTENHDGWVKYTIGAFDTYKTARNRRNTVTAGYTFPGPFVTAYNSGSRITVQEALMISNQKWIQ